MSVHPLNVLVINTRLTSIFEVTMFKCWIKDISFQNDEIYIDLVETMYGEDHYETLNFPISEIENMEGVVNTIFQNRKAAYEAKKANEEKTHRQAELRLLEELARKHNKIIS